MRIISVLIPFVFVALGACGDVVKTTRCCVSEQDCASIGIDEVKACEGGQTCNADHACEATQCETSAQCDATAPICRLNVCESTCVDDPECADFAGQTHCGPDAICVECVTSSQCSGDKAVCDADDHACRGCERDNECASGVCIEAEGTCALEANVLFVANGSDTGTCTKVAPCLTLSYAVSKVTSASPRNVIRIEGGLAASETATINVTTRLVIDGTGTVVRKPTASLPWMSVSASGQVVIDGLTMEGTSDQQNPLIKVTNASLLFGPQSILKGFATTTSGSLIVDRGRIEGTVDCNSGTLTIDRAAFEEGRAQSTNCQLTIQRSRFNKSSDGMLGATGGKATIENNLFVNSYELSDSTYVTGVSPGSVFRFNTIANVSGTDSDGVALYCDATLKVSSNIFAYRSQHPFAYQSPCKAEFSIFDDHTLSSALMSSDSQFVPFTAIFTDPIAKDFTLSASSPARGAADPAITEVMFDIDGRVRPAGAADSGAFEAP